MPQSLKYDNKISEAKEAADWMTRLAGSGSKGSLKTRAILTWRQRNSFEEGQVLYPLVNNKLVPDIAFMIGPIEDSDAWTSREKVDILFLLRDDKESVHVDKRNVETSWG